MSTAPGSVFQPGGGTTCKRDGACHFTPLNNMTTLTVTGGAEVDLCRLSAGASELSSGDTLLVRRLFVRFDVSA